MAPPGPLRLVSHGGRRFLCFCQGGSGSPRLQLTDGCDFWSCTVPWEKLDGQEEPGCAPDGLSKVREILQDRTPTLTVHESKATLQGQDSRGQSVTFDLYKASPPEASRQLQDLTFGLVEQLQTLEKRLEDLSPWKPRGGASPSKRRLPGESLINPGFRSKKIPTGVDFEEA